MKGGRYLTLKNENFVITKRNGTKNQLFTWSPSDKTIHTVANKDLLLDISQEGKNRDLIAKKSNGKWDQQFRFRGDRVENIRGVVLTVEGNVDKDGQNVIVWKKSNGLSSRWNFVYADQNGQDGLIPGKPFRLVSQMKSGRVLTQAGNNVVIRTRNDKEAQIFILDEKSKTIEPYKNRSVSLDIADWGHNRYTKFEKT